MVSVVTSTTLSAALEPSGCGPWLASVPAPHALTPESTQNKLKHPPIRFMLGYGT